MKTDGYDVIIEGVNMHIDRLDINIASIAF